MKRILFSCFLTITFLFQANQSAAQLFNFTTTPNSPICFNPTNTYTALAGVGAHAPTATDYSWTVTNPPGGNSSITVVPGLGIPSNSIIALSFTNCGTYTINLAAWNNTVAPGGVVVAQVLSQFEIICPSGGSITVTPSVACKGEQQSWAGVTTGPAPAPNSFTWSNGFVGNPLILTANSNTCFTYTVTTPLGCTVAAAAACGSVQSINLSASPASQTICAGAPVCFTSVATVATGASVTPGTTIQSYSWFPPGNNPPAGPAFAGTPNACTLAANGEYTVVVTHNGAAGVCTLQATNSVVTSNNISANITANSASVCSGAPVQLTGVSIQTVANSYTWTTPAGTLTGNPIVQNPTVATVYTVDVDYFGCPGTATIEVGMLSLTPTITAPSPYTCPNQSLAVTALPGNALTSHTFYAYPACGGTVGPLNTTAPNIATLTAGDYTCLPYQIVVNSYSNGCTGSATVIVNPLTLTPTLSIISSASGSVCPGTEFTLSSTGGAGTNYTFVAPYYLAGVNNTIIASSSNTVAHTPVPSFSVPPNTYTVYVDSAGCLGETYVTSVQFSLTPNLTLSSPSICAGSALSMTASGGAGSTYTFYAPVFTTTPTSEEVISLGVSNNTVHTPPFGGTINAVTYTVTVDSAGCQGTTTRSVGILDLGPTMTVTASSPSICPNTEFTLSATGALNYTFVMPPQANMTNTTSNPVPITPTTVGAGITFTVLGDSLGCAGTKTITIFEKKLNPTISISNSLVCAGMPVTVTANDVGIGSSTTFTFFAGVIPITPTAHPFPNATHNPTSNTVYAVRVDSANCTNAAPFPTVAVQIRPALLLAPQTTAASVCPGTGATLEIPGPANSGAVSNFTWTWTQSSGTGSMNPGAPYPAPSGSTSAVVNPVTTSSYSVNVADSLGCVGSTVITIGIDPLAELPVLLSSSGSTICGTQTVGLAATTTINTIGNVTYSWSPPTPPISGSSVVVNPSVTTVYTVVATNGLGCFGSHTILVPVGQFPVPPSFTVNASHNAVCSGFTSTLTAFGANSYTWTGSSFTNAIAQQSISVSWGSYTVLGSNGGGCTATTVFNVTQASSLNIVATAQSPTTCIANNTPKFSKPVQLNATGASSYVWYPYNPIHMTYSLGPQTTVRPPASTCYTVIGSTAVCSGSTTICLNVVPQFTMNVVPPLPAICLGDSLKLNITNVGPQNMVAGLPSAWTYSWTEALNAPPISISNNLSPTVMVWPQNTTTYSVEVFDTRACVSMPRLVTVTVLPRPITAIAIPTINSIPTNSLCYVGLNPGESNVTINLIGSNQNTNLQFGVVPTYTWLSPYKKEYNSILTPVNNNAVTVNAPLKLPTTVTYSLISGYNGIPGCYRLDTVTVRVVDCRPVRNVYFETAEQNDTLCSRTCVTFVNRTDTAAGGPQETIWTFEGGNPPVSTEANPTVCYNLPGRWNVILEVRNKYPTVNPGGPTGSARKVGFIDYIKVDDVPNVTIISPGQLKSDTVVRFGQSVDLKGSGAKRYEWSPSYNISSLTDPNVRVSPFKTTQYILTGYNSKNCFSSDTINVIVIEDCGEMYVPNAFTPNNDGHNDVLYVRGICMQSLTFMVFNRWGEKVFETTDQKVGWDGTYRGEPLNTGVYVYRLEGKTYDGKGFSAKGNVTLLR